MGRIFDLSSRLVSESWREYRHRFSYFVKTDGIATSIFMGAIGVVTLLGAFLIRGEMHALSQWLMATLAAGGNDFNFANFPRATLLTLLAKLCTTILVDSFLWFWMDAIFWRSTLSKNSQSISHILKEGRAYLTQLYGEALLRLLIISVGFLFFVGPGLLFAGLFLFSDICVLSGERPTDALRTSAGLIMGRWRTIVMPAFISFCAISLLPTLIQFVLLSGLARAVWRGAPSIHAWIYGTAIGSVVVWALFALIALPWYRVFKKLLFEYACKTVAQTVILNPSASAAL